MATDKRGRRLPRGVRATQSGFEGRFMYRGISYSVSGQSVREVSQKLSEAKFRVMHGVDVRKEDVTVASWAETWLKTYKQPSVRDSTYYRVERTITMRILPVIGRYRLADVRPEHVQQMLNDWAAEGLSRRTISSYRVCCLEMFGQAVKNGLIERNPVGATVPPRSQEPGERVVLTHEQKALFLQYAESSWLYNLFDLALRTGMRVGELIALKVSDIDWLHGVIHVQRTMAYTGNGYHEHDTKTRAGTRDIPITLGIEKTIRAQLRRPVASIDGLLFSGPSGYPVSAKTISREIRRIIESARADGHQLPDFSSHTFRHTFATHAVEAGMSLQDLKGILGHSSLAMTADLYAHVTMDAKRKAMEQIDSVI